MKKLIFSILASVGCLAIATAQMNPIEFVEYDLPNGLHVILHQDNSTPVVAVSVLYHVGSKNENPERTGFAHFFEHLLFEGTENIKKEEGASGNPYFMMVQGAGGTLNANTSMDRTFYYEKLPSNELELGLWMESERMLHAKVDITGVEIQREVVKEERRQRTDNQPYGTFVEEAMKRAFKKHPYRWPVIGSMAHLDAAEEQDYKDFYKLFYVPNNATLSVAGDIDIEKTKAMIAKYYTDIPAGTKAIPRPTVIEPALGGEIRDTVYDNIQLPGVFQVYRLPAQGTDDFYAVSMLSTLMSQGQSSRLYKAVVDDAQKAVQVGNFPMETEDPGVAFVFAIANAGVDPAEAESVINAEFEKVRTELISDTELEKLKNQIEANFINDKTSVTGIAESLANYHTYFGDANLINTEIDRYLAVTKEDIQRIAQKYFVKDNRVVLYYLPKSAQP